MSTKLWAIILAVLIAIGLALGGFYFTRQPEVDPYVETLAECINPKTQLLTVIGGQENTQTVLYVVYDLRTEEDDSVQFAAEHRIIFSCVLDHGGGLDLGLVFVKMQKVTLWDIEGEHYGGRQALILTVKNSAVLGAVKSENVIQFLEDSIRSGNASVINVARNGLDVPRDAIYLPGVKLAIERHTIP